MPLRYDQFTDVMEQYCYKWNDASAYNDYK